MKRLSSLPVSILFATLLIIPLTARGDNVALNKPTTLSGYFNYQYSPPSYDGASASSLVDSVYLDEGNYWAQNTVFWSPYFQGGQGEQYITIDLLGSYIITGLSVQADENDRYLLSYLDSSTSIWIPIWTVPSNYDDSSISTGGMSTRSETLGVPINTTMLRFEGVYSDGQVFSDNYFSVSEIQAYGPSTAVPEPTTMFLLGSGLIGLAGYGRKKFFKK